MSTTARDPRHLLRTRARTRTFTLAMVGLLASTALVACGSDDDAADSTAAPTSAAATTTAAAVTSTVGTDGTAITDAPASTDAPAGTDGSASTTAGSTDAAPDTTAPASNGEPVELSLVAFSVPKAADEAIQEAFAASPQGAGTTFSNSYGASGDQSRAVVAGQDADIVHFSLEGDVTRLVKEGLVAEDWNAGPNKGILSSSVVVIAVRPGNPKNIQGWDDLVQDGVQIITPNPGSSGSARWNILAAYGHVLANGGTEDDAKAYLTKFFENTVALPGSGRDATTAFLEGTGDALISYENEAILARQAGSELDYVVPAETLLIENPAAVLADADERATAFLDFALSEEGQTEFVKKGFRPVGVEVSGVEVEGANDPADPFPTPKTLLTIADDFGGWSDASSKFFDEDEGIVTKIQTDTGKTG